MTPLVIFTFHLDVGNHVVQVILFLFSRLKSNLEFSTLKLERKRGHRSKSDFFFFF